MQSALLERLEGSGGQLTIAPKPCCTWQLSCMDTIVFNTCTSAMLSVSPVRYFVAELKPSQVHASQ